MTQGANLVRAATRSLLAVLVGSLVLIISLFRTRDALAYTGNYHYHEGFVKHTVFEQFHVTATEVRIVMGYTQDTDTRFPGSREVAGGKFDDTPDSNSYCYDSGFANGWEQRRCAYYLLHGAPYTEEIDIEGEFYYKGGIAHYQQHAFFKALNDDRVEYNCYFDFGSLPINWTSECYGGRTK